MTSFRDLHIFNQPTREKKNWKKLDRWCFFHFLSLYLLSNPLNNRTSNVSLYSCIHLDRFGDILYENICPVSWGCWIHRLLLCRRVRPPTPNVCLRYDTKQSDGNVPVSFGECRVPLHCPKLTGLLWPGVVAPDKGPIYGLNRTKPWFLEFTAFCI